MSHPIGIMQGRLSARPQGRPQVFPLDTWAGEFEAARGCGFDGIEWLVTDAHLDRNPLLHAIGRQDIRARVEASGVPLLSVCADVFVHRTFVGAAAGRRPATLLLMELIDGCALLNIPRLVVPVLESARPATTGEVDELCGALEQPLSLARAAGVALLIESDLNEGLMDAVLTRLPEMQVCVDTGNSAARGSNAADELRRWATRVTSIHIKDRPLGGANVPLGEGAVDFPSVARAARHSAPGVPLILETVVGDDPLASARRNLLLTQAWFGARAAASP